MSCSDRMQAVLDKLQIPYEKEIKGNITLLEQIGEASISWESSKETVISTKAQGTKAPGVVNRTEKTEVVTLKATVTMDNNGQMETAKKEFKVTVCKAPAKLTEADFQGYLFGHFIGEGTADQEQIYFAISEDGLNFKDMNGEKPILETKVGEKGVRDPYICRSHEGDRFFLIATDLSIYHRGGWFKNDQGYYDASTTGSSNLVLWESDDLVHWGEPRLIDVAPKNAGMAWAPEMVYDDERGEYIIFFSSSIMDPVTKYKAKPNAIYYVATRDFVHFSETKLFIDCQKDDAVDGKEREIIDTTVLKIGDYYYSASKDGDNDEKNGGIRIMKNKNLLDANGWEKVLDLDELDLDLTGLKISVLDNSTLEGPELFCYNQKDWADPNVPEYGIMADQYAVGAGYLPLKTTNFEDVDNSKKSWTLLKADEYSFDRLKKRHGTIIRITKDELENLKRVFL